MFSYSSSYFGSSTIISWCHIYYITSVILYIFSGCVTANEYYVSAASNGLFCHSTDLPCHNLSYYIANYDTYFTDDVIFYFQEGTHTLQGILEITNISNITLQGLGHIEQNFHETVMQSTSVIMCSVNKRAGGIKITTSKSILMKSLTIANCSFDAYISDKKIVNSLHFVDINYVTMECVSVQNGSGYGLCLVNNFDVLIANSSFANNGHPASFQGNIYIYYDDQLKNLSRVNIVQSNFSMSLGFVLYLMYDSEVKIIIENSEFSHNIGGGVLIDSSGNSTIEFNNCIIYNNNAKYNGGGVSVVLHGKNSIEFNNCTIYKNNAKHRGGGVSINLYGKDSIEFHHCTIYNNNAKYNGGGVSVVLHGKNSIEFNNCTIYKNNAKHRGGGVSINLYEKDSIEFHHCTIYNNNAKYNGGGVSVVLHGKNSIEFNNCTIYKNNAKHRGGGVSINLYEKDSIEFHHCTIYNNIVEEKKGTGGGGGGVSISTVNGSIKLHNCFIYNNTVHHAGGGGVLILLYGRCNIDFCNCTICINSAWKRGGGVSIHSDGSGSIQFSNSIIYNNTAYLGSGILVSGNQFNSKTSFLFTNVSCHFNQISNRNDVYQAAFVLVDIYQVVFDQIEVSNHNTTGLVSFNSLITFEKNNTFENNSGIYGGGIALYESSRLLLRNQTYIFFSNNYASESGGGIFVKQLLVEYLYTKCFFQCIHDNSVAWLYFVNNKANISGDVLYGGQIDNCNFDLFNYPQQRGLSIVSSDPIQVCFCVSGKPNCSVSNKKVTAMPGIDVNISLAAVGSKDGLTKGVIKLTSSNSSSTIKINKNTLKAACTNITFKLNANPSLLNATDIYATLDSLQDHHAKVINVTIEYCPIGFLLVNDTCVCRSELNTPPISCDINTQIITRDVNMWIGYKNISKCLIVYQNCPFDYCNDNIIHFKVTSPNAQCHYNRSGLLCGQCAEGFSLMLGSNQCGQCTNDYLVLIIPFAVAGIALVAFVIILNLTVSVGTINGLIFYANIIKIYEQFFFPNGRIPFVSHFISWLNLDLGIETCFYNGMNSCYKTWLQFIFPGYVWFLVILIIMLSKYSSKVVRFVGRQSIPVLATMILLSYTKLIRTVFQVLHYTNIYCRGNNNVTLLRWYIDANVQYFTGCHLLLFLFSLVILILLIVPYTFYLLTMPLFEGPLSKYMCCCQTLLKYMKPFFDAYGGPYKDKCRFWTGFLLLIRVVLALVVSLDTEATISLDVLTSVLFVIVSLYFLLRGIYQNLLLACLEMSFFLNLMFMAYVNVSTQNFKTLNSSQVLSVAMVSLSCVVFCGIILYHVWDRLLMSRLKKLITSVKRIFKKPEPFFNSDGAEVALMRPGSPSFTCETSSVSVVSVKMRRESLLFDEDD